MLKQILTSAAMIFAATSVLNAQSDSSKPSLTITGYGDAYIKYDFAKTDVNNKTSFTNSQNSFELGMASIKAEYTKGKTGFVADLGFGKRAEEFSYNDAGTIAAIKQLYFTLQASKKIKIYAGSFTTHIGYELVDAYSNKNYSMSYMFSYGPFFHTGVKAEYALGGKSTLMLGIVNPTDLKTATGQNKFIIGQLATGSKDDKLKLYVNYQGGNATNDSRLNQGDVVATYAASAKVSLGFNATYQTIQNKVANKWESANNWYGAALYLGYDASSKFGLYWRNELFSDEKSLTAAGLGGGSVFASTLSANYKVGPLTIIPELRLDNGSKDIFVKSNGGLTKSATNFLLAAVYKF